jgi:hypothetical protein
MPRVCASIVIILNLRENLSVEPLHFKHKEICISNLAYE